MKQRQGNADMFKMYLLGMGGGILSIEGRQ